jgi:hypothetical protein
VRYDRVLYLLEDTVAHRKLIGRTIEVWEYPDGRIELRADGQALPYREYDKLTEVDAGAIVEHKRLSHALQIAQSMQAQRDNRRIATAPSRTNVGAAVRSPNRSPGTKKQREFTQADMNLAIEQLAQQHVQAQPTRRKSGRRSAGRIA